METYSPGALRRGGRRGRPEKPSRVRLFTLIGGLTGVVTGYAMTIWMANDWQIMIGGKPFSSIPPYTIIAFELTILFGGVADGARPLRRRRLPRVGKLDSGLQPASPAEEFGLVVSCRDATWPRSTPAARAPREGGDPCRGVGAHADLTRSLLPGRCSADGPRLAAGSSGRTTWFPQMKRQKAVQAFERWTEGTRRASCRPRARARGSTGRRGPFDGE